MPELPEVEITRRGLAAVLCGQRVLDVEVRNPRLRQPVAPDLLMFMQGRKLLALQRRGKYLLFDFGKATLLVHLGMSGSLRMVPTGQAPEKHDHVDLCFENVCLRYRDPRRFGLMLWHVGDVREHPLLSGLGPEPLEEGFDEQYLFDSFRRCRLSIKPALMSSRRVVGVGNIYASESLFRAGIHPLRTVDALSRQDCAHIVRAVRETLLAALAAGGSSLRDFVDAAGQAGYFQLSCSVYGRGSQPCRICATPIRKMMIGQRASYWCPGCQPR